MSIINFKWYVHGSSLWENKGFLDQQLGFEVSEELLDKIGNPFYEITLNCDLDTVTGDVTLISAYL